MKNLLTTSFLAINLLGGVVFAQGNNPNSSNTQGTTQWKTNGNMADSNHFIGTKNEFPVKFRTYDVERMRITKEGNVGIGTDNPQERLDVKGNIIFRDGDFFLNNLLDSVILNNEVLLIDSSGKVTRGGDLKDLVYKSRGNQYPCKYNGGGIFIPEHPVWENAPGLLFTSDQCVPDVKVGIGTKTPESKLHIKMSGNTVTTHAIIVEKSNGQKILQLTKDGLLLAREIKVDLATWSDYVFDPAYPLMPLEEVKSFIEENHHLPNVPSAADMVENGLNVADASIMLMEKVEELTLYMIQLQEQVKKQDELLKVQQQLIEQLQESGKN